MDGEIPDSLLTNTQRRYLQGNADELSSDAERMKRSRIRKRIRAGIEDFDIVFKYLEDRDREQITEFNHRLELIPEANQEDELHDSQVFAEGLMSMVAFAAQCAEDMGVKPESLFEASLHRYAERTPEIDAMEIDVSVDRRTVDLFANIGDRLDRLQERFKDRNHLSTTQIQMLFERNRINLHDVEAYFEDMQDLAVD